MLAVPVAASDTIEELRGEVDALICLEAPRRFGAVGSFYADFRQVADEEVSAILARFPVEAAEKGVAAQGRPRSPPPRRAAR